MFWHPALTRTERMRLNHPSTVWCKWKAATAERETLPQTAPSGWGGAIETLIAAKREGAFLKMTDVDPVLSAAPYRRRDLTDSRHRLEQPGDRGVDPCEWLSG
jgi:hypothetical protein